MKDEWAGESTSFTSALGSRSRRTVHSDAHGAPISVEETMGNRWEWIRHDRRPAEREVRTFNGKGSFLQETYRLEGGEWAKTGETRFGKAGLMACMEPNGEVGDDYLDARLADFLRSGRSIVRFTARVEQGGYTDIGANTRVRGCANYPDGGVESVARDLQAGIDQGLACLDRLYDSHRRSRDQALAGRVGELRRAARRFTGNFIEGATHPFTIQCYRPWSSYGPDEEIEPGNMLADPERDWAFALTCQDNPQDETSPGIQLNVEWFNLQTPNRRRSVFFHELIHHGSGYLHRVGTFDQVMLLERCCFGTGTTPPPVRGIERSQDCREALSRDHGTPL